jgi:hypothetical protein
MFTFTEMKVDIFWDTVPCSPYVIRRFGGTYHLHFQGLKSAEQKTSVQKVTPKRRFTYGLHGAISQKMETLITTAVRTSTSTDSHKIHIIYHVPTTQSSDRAAEQTKSTRKLMDYRTSSTHTPSRTVGSRLHHRQLVRRTVTPPSNNYYNLFSKYFRREIALHTVCYTRQRVTVRTAEPLIVTCIPPSSCTLLATEKKKQSYSPNRLWSPRGCDMLRIPHYLDSR